MGTWQGITNARWFIPQRKLSQHFCPLKRSPVSLVLALNNNETAAEEGESAIMKRLQRQQVP